MLLSLLSKNFAPFSTFSRWNEEYLDTRDGIRETIFLWIINIADGPSSS